MKSLSITIHNKNKYHQRVKLFDVDSMHLENNGIHKDIKITGDIDYSLLLRNLSGDFKFFTGRQRIKTDGKRISDSMITINCKNDLGSVLCMCIDLHTSHHQLVQNIVDIDEKIEIDRNTYIEIDVKPNETIDMIFLISQHSGKFETSTQREEMLDLEAVL